MDDGRVKASLRRSAKEARARIPEPDRAAWSAAIRARLEALNGWRDARTVALYAPIAGEADLLPLVEGARASGKRVVFPRARTGTSSLEFFEVTSAAELRPGAYGVPEPPAREERRVVAAELDLLVLPGLAFDPEGRRLGFGGGYYDRFLAASIRRTVGIAFESQICAALPEEEHDRGVEVIVTEARTITAPATMAAPARESRGKGTR